MVRNRKFPGKAATRLLAASIAWSLSAQASNPMDALLLCMGHNRDLSRSPKRPLEALASEIFLPPGSDASSSQKLYGFVVEELPRKPGEASAPLVGWIYTPEGATRIPWSASREAIAEVKLPFAGPDGKPQKLRLGLSLGVASPRDKEQAHYPDSIQETGTQPETFEQKAQARFGRPSQKLEPLKPGPWLKNEKSTRDSLIAHLKRTFDGYLVRCKSECPQAYQQQQALQASSRVFEQQRQSFSERRVERYARLTSLQDQIARLTQTPIHVILGEDGKIEVMKTLHGGGSHFMDPKDTGLHEDVRRLMQRMEPIAQEQQADYRGYEALWAQHHKESLLIEQKLASDLSVDAFWEGLEACRSRLSRQPDSQDPDFDELRAYLKATQEKLEAQWGHLAIGQRMPRRARAFVNPSQPADIRRSNPANQ